MNFNDTPAASPNVRQNLTPPEIPISHVRVLSSEPYPFQPRRPLLPDPFPRFFNQPPRFRNKTIRCYHCKQMNHTWRNCNLLNRLPCTVCGYTTHSAEQCARRFTPY